MYSLAPLFWHHQPADKNVGPDGQKDFQHSRTSHNSALYDPSIHPSPYPPVPKCSKTPNNATTTNSSNHQAVTTNTNTQPINNNNVAATTIARVLNE
jgi:hypothetical protein